MANKKKKKWNKYGWIGFGVTFVALGGLSWIVGLIGGVAVGNLINTMSEGSDLTTHNRQDLKEGEMPRPSTIQRNRPIVVEGSVLDDSDTAAKQSVPRTQTRQMTPKKTMEIDSVPLSGNEQADAVIRKGKEMIHQIRSENDAIPDAHLTYQMDQLERVCTQIFRTISDKPDKAPEIRKFMNYYLPTTLKMLSSYHTMQDRGVSYGDMQEAQKTLVKGLDMILTACQKQLDTLYKDTMLDVSTDIDVLEKMLERDGFKDSAFADAMADAMDPVYSTAAATSIMDGVPVLKMPEQKEHQTNDTTKNYRSSGT